MRRMTAEASFSSVGYKSVQRVTIFKGLEAPSTAIPETFLLSLHDRDHLAIALAECLVAVLHVCKSVDHQDRTIVELASLESLDGRDICIEMLDADLVFRPVAL
jgi:hypothetical protein